MVCACAWVCFEPRYTSKVRGTLARFSTASWGTGLVLKKKKERAALNRLAMAARGGLVYEEAPLKAFSLYRLGAGIVSGVLARNRRELRIAQVAKIPGICLDSRGLPRLPGFA